MRSVKSTVLLSREGSSTIDQRSRLAKLIEGGLSIKVRRHTIIYERADTDFDCYRVGDNSELRGGVLMFAMLGQYGDPLTAYRAFVAEKDTALNTFSRLLLINKSLLQCVVHLHEAGHTAREILDILRRPRDQSP
jgi:hypothetical protein